MIFNRLKFPFSFKLNGMPFSEIGGSVDVKGLLIETLETFQYPVYLQGSLSDEDEFPDSFFTFFNNDTVDSNFFDNQETETIWDFDLNFYSNDPTLVNSVLVQAKSLLKEVGFIVDGKGYDVLSNNPTHTGRAINVLYIEKVR